MTEIKYDVISSCSIYDDKIERENDLLEIISHKKKEKRNGSGEDINITVLAVLDELYKKSTISADAETNLVSKINKSGVDNISTHELLQSKKNSQMLLTTVETHKRAGSLNRSENLMPVKSHIQSTDFTVPAMSETRKHISEQREKIYEDQIKEMNQLAGRVTNDVTQHRHDISRQDIPLPKRQPSVVDQNLRSPTEIAIPNKSSHKQLINIDYSFLRWAGEHSVKVAMPLEQRSLQRLTLHPSDTRAAEVIARQAPHLYGFNTELLHPQQDDEEPPSKQRQYSGEEDQE